MSRDPMFDPLWDKPSLAGNPVRNKRRALLVRRGRKLAERGVLVAAGAEQDGRQRAALRVLAGGRP